MLGSARILSVGRPKYYFFATRYYAVRVKRAVSSLVIGVTCGLGRTQHQQQMRTDDEVDADAVHRALQHDQHQINRTSPSPNIIVIYTSNFC